MPLDEPERLSYTSGFGAALLTLLSLPILATPVPIPDDPVLIASLACPSLARAIPERPPPDFLLVFLVIKS